MPVRPVQPENAESPMLVTLSGMTMLVRLLQPQNASSPMLDPPVITTVFKDGGTYELLSEYELAPNIYPKWVLLVPLAVVPTKGNVILVKLLQFSNASSPILVTLSGISMLVKLLQPENAESPMLVTPLPMVMLVRLLQPENAESPMLVTLFGITMLVSLLQSENS